MISSLLHAPVTILGGGPAGCILSLLLADKGIETHVVDKPMASGPSTPQGDSRAWALSAFSHGVLCKLGLWEHLAPLSCPMDHIKIGHNGPHILTEFTSEFAGRQGPMGYMIAASALRTHLQEEAKKCPLVTWHAQEVLTIEANSTHITLQMKEGPALTTHLLIGADGRHSAVRPHVSPRLYQWDYDEHALTATLKHNFPHHNTAYELFCSSGALALLPLHGGYHSSLVWMNTPERTKRLLELDSPGFIAQLSEYVQDLGHGAMSLEGARTSYPLGVRMPRKIYAHRMALVGDAAHVIHPLAGQGLNVGIADVWTLADLLQNAYGLGMDLGELCVLEAYGHKRFFPQWSMLAATQGLNHLFSNDIAWLKSLRHWGLKTFNHLPIAKRLAIAKAMGPAL